LPVEPAPAVQSVHPEPQNGSPYSALSQVSSERAAQNMIPKMGYD